MSGWRLGYSHLYAPHLFIAGRRLRTRFRLTGWALGGWLDRYPEGNVYTLHLGPVLAVTMVEWWYE